jgi:DNA polymerase III subunit gamma/tau
MSWYNKYRPQSFEDVVGQELVKSVLQNAIAKNLIKQAYLFSGSRGVGKTTLARIFANLLNQVETYPEAKIDIIELDAASNTGIDNIRQLIENASTPALSGKYKIYIIDEVHMLSKSAMSALLKTLEEPPKHVVFLLATTNPEKLLPTVLSRLTKLPLSSHTIQNIVGRLQFIAKAETLKIDTESLELIAKRAEGSQRDAINLMETVSSYNLDEFSVEKTAEILGVIPETFLVEIADKIVSQNLDKNFLQKLTQINFDAETFLGQFLEFLLDQTLSGNSDYGSLVPTTAEVLSWKLPVTSIAQTIALLQANLNQKEGMVSVKKKPVENRSTVVNSEVRKVDFAYSQNDKHTPSAIAANPFEKGELLTPGSKHESESKENLSSIKKVDLVESESGKHAPSPSVPPLSKGELLTQNSNLESDLNTNSNSLFSKMLKASNAPTILKMLGHDLRLESVENNKAIFSVTTNLFLSQLKSATLQNFLKEFLTSELKFAPQIENIIRAKSTAPNPKFEPENFQDISYEEPPKESYEIQDFDTPTPPPKITQDEPENNLNLVAGKKIFYEVYKQIPEGFSNPNVPVYKDQIPSPVAKNIHDEWESEVESMFELE